MKNRDKKKNAGASTPAFFNTGGNLRRNISKSALRILIPQTLC